MKFNKRMSVILIGTILLSTFSTVLINKFLLQKEEKTKDTKITSVVLRAEGGIARKAINKEIDWVLVNESTKQVVTKKTNGSTAEIQLQSYANTEKNNWMVSAKSESYSGIAQLNNENLQSGEFKIFLSEIQSAIDVELVVQKSARATTNIPIKWDVPKGINAKINIQQEEEEPLFYAPPNIFTANYKTNETMLRMPSDAGKYVIRLYDTKHTNEPLKEIIIEVIKANIEIKAPSEATAGTSINLSWVSPESSQGQINIKEKSEKIEYYSRYYVRTRGIKSVNLVLPSDEGEYVLRWYDFYSKKLVTEKNIRINKAKIELHVKNKVKVGEKVLVRWNAPENSMATVYLRGEIDGETEAVFTINGKTEFEMVMPEKAGLYYLTWISDGDKKEMKRQAIEVIEDD